MAGTRLRVGVTSFLDRLAAKSTPPVFVAAGMGAEVTVLDLSLPRLRHLDEAYRGQFRTAFASRAMTEDLVAAADLVIGAVLIPGAAAPKLITRAMLGTMRPGAAIVDGEVSVARGLRAPIASISDCSTPFVLALERRVSQPVSTPSATAATATSTATPRPRRTHSPAPSEFLSAANTRPPISSASPSEVAAPAA